METVYIVGIVSLLTVALFLVRRWADIKEAQVAKEVTLAAIEAGLVQQPVPKVVLDTWDRQKTVTELAWVKK